MFLHRSNHSERLVDRLSEVVRRPLVDPLAPEVIVVQSKGMERWLAMELSARLGVWANARFPFPRHLLEQVYDAVLGEQAQAAVAFGDRTLTFSVAALLPDLLAEPAFAPLARYLDGDDGRLQFQLAQRIARVLDDYGVYRPELLLRFERGEEQGWEALLFRALCARHGSLHPAARADRLLQALSRASTEPLAGLPERVCLFGISSLPPLYLSLLSALAPHVELHLFLLSPSREYFGDLRKARAGTAQAEAPVGHPLLASLGRLGREFQELLEERTGYREDERDLYVDPGRGTLLRAVQSDILHLRDAAAPRLPIAADDDSIAIHVCHGPMREIEVLHDQLTALLEDSRLAPHDIAVMAPDIELFAPVIEAVFGQSSGRPQIPYSVADRKTKNTHEAVNALFSLLDALQSRMTASTVLDLLGFECVRRRFGIDSEELERVRAWVEESGVRWGVDAAHRGEVGQPELAQNTWRFGLDRMLLGYAMQGRGRELYSGVLPYDPIEGSAAELLGKLATLCERLFEQRGALAMPRPVARYCADLGRLVDDMLDLGPTGAHELELLRSALFGLAEAAHAGGFGAAIDLRSLRVQLERTLDERLPARGLLTRGVTFCQLVPMRSIPFQVVCLIGMNDGAFPGPNPVLGVGNLSDTGKRPGDRSRRDDDRYMFLEALLCARRKLIISYAGRSIHDNRVLPPSVLVSELIDTVAAGFEPAGSEPDAAPLDRRAAIEARLCVQHRLHAFSPRYFEADSDGPLFSYSARDCEGSRARSGPRRQRPLLQTPLPVSAALTELTLDELCAWLTHPIRTFAQQQLGLHMGIDLAPLEDREPVALDALDSWKLGNGLLELALAGAEPSELLPIARARGELPLGTLGELECEQILPHALALSRATLQHRRGERLDPLPLAIDVDGLRITGALHDLFPGAHLTTSYSKVGKRFELVHFLKHVLLCCAQARDPQPGYPQRSVVVARGEGAGEIRVVEFEAMFDPEATLRALLALVRAGRTWPLPFTYDAGRAYAGCVFENGRDRDAALRVAQRVFDDERIGDANDDYVKLFYPSFERLAQGASPHTFPEIATAVFEPFYRHRSLA